MKKKREWGTLLPVDGCTHGHETHVRPSETQKPTTKSFSNLSVLIIFSVQPCWSEWRDHPSTRAAALNPGVTNNSPSETGHWVKSRPLRVTPAGRALQRHFLRGAEKAFNNVHVRSLEILPLHWTGPDQTGPDRTHLRVWTLGFSHPQMVPVSPPPTAVTDQHTARRQSVDRRTGERTLTLRA